MRCSVVDFPRHVKVAKSTVVNAEVNKRNGAQHGVCSMWQWRGRNGRSGRRCFERQLSVVTWPGRLKFQPVPAGGAMNEASEVPRKGRQFILHHVGVVNLSVQTVPASVVGVVVVLVPSHCAASARVVRNYGQRGPSRNKLVRRYTGTKSHGHDMLQSLYSDDTCSGVNASLVVRSLWWRSLRGRRNFRRWHAKG